MTRMKIPVANPGSITFDEAVALVGRMRLKETPLAELDAEKFSEAVGADVARPVLDIVRRIIEDVNEYYGPEQYRDPCLAIYLNYQDPNGPYPEGAGELYLDFLIRCSDEDPGCHDGLHRIADYHLHRRLLLPDLLQQWMNRRRPRPTAEQGGNPDLNAIRNVGILHAMFYLKQRGMQAERNDSSPHTSACDAVAEAVTEVEAVRMTFDAVKKVWQKGSITIKGKRWLALMDRASFAYEQQGPGAYQNKSNQRS